MANIARHKRLNFRHFWHGIFAVFLLLSLAPGKEASGQALLLTTSNSYYQDFNTLPSLLGSSVLWTDNVTIPYWYMQRMPVVPPGGLYPINVIADDGNQLGSGTGSGYSYGTIGSTERALGSVGSNNVNSGHYAWGIQLQNTSGFVISDFNVAYRGEQWRDGGVSNQTQQITYYYKKSATAITNLTPNFITGWTGVAALTFSAPVNSNSGVGVGLNGNLPANSAIKSNSFGSSLILNNSEYMMMKWDDKKYGGMIDMGMSTDSVVISWTVCAPPPTQASNLISPAQGLNDITLQWTNGSGSGRIVIINTVNSFTPPSDGTLYPANTVYGGTGEQVVYNGGGATNSVIVTGLEPCREYFFQVFEYSCTGVNSRFNNSVPGANNPNSFFASMANIPLIFSITGASSYCSPAEPGVEIGLEDSQTGVSYQLYLDGVAVAGATVNGNTGFPVTFGFQTAAGIYTVVATYGTYTYCVSDMANPLTVTVNASPVAPDPITTPLTTICGDGIGTISLTAANGSGTTLEWYAGTCGSAVIGTSSPLVIPSPTVTTTYFARWTTLLCGNSVCQQITINVDTPPTVADAGPAQSLCGSFTATLAGNIPTSGTGLWTSVSGPAPIAFTDPALNNTAITATVQGTYVLQWTITNGAVCLPSSAQVTIVFSDALVVTAASNSPVCSGADILLTSDIAGATYAWTGPGSFTSTDQNPIIPNSTTANSGTYSVTVTNIPGGCPATSNSTDIVVNQSAIAATSALSTPGALCADDAGNIVLSVPDGNGDVLNWYEGSCTGTPIGTGNNLSIPSPTVTTTYYAEWTSISCGNAACVPVTVTVIDPPTIAVAGGSQSLCGVVTTTLAGNDPVIGSGIWTQISGPGTITFVDATAFNTNITASVMGTYVLRWTISNGAVCQASFSEVTIDFSNSISVIAGSNSPVCPGDIISLTSSIAGATYSWTGPNGFASVIQNPLVTNNATALEDGTYTVNVTNIPGGCPPTSDNVAVIVMAKPVTPAITSTGITGTDQTVCNGTNIPYSIATPT
ncbi:MAG: hypothetical protein ACOYMF_09555, partial [Bacteroidales bacterium]